MILNAEMPLNMEEVFLGSCGCERDLGVAAVEARAVCVSRIKASKT